MEQTAEVDSVQGEVMGDVWRAEDAKARFSELLETSVTEGPQVVTKRGVPTAVLVPFEQWRRLSRASEPDLKELLLAPEPRTEELALPRRQFRYRDTPLNPFATPRL